MENISKILTAIHEDGAAEAERILKGGQKNAQDLAKLYNEEAAVQKVNVLKKAQKRADEITQRSISQVGISARNSKLTARRDAIEKAFILAGERLAQLPDEKKLALYAGLIGKYSSTKKVTVILNECDRKALGAKLTEEAASKYGVMASLSPAAGDFSGGLVMEEGSVEINCTFEVLAEEFRKEAETEVAAVLFEI